MNTANSCAAGAAALKENATKKSNSILDSRSNKPIPDYRVYLGTVFASTGAHGHFRISDRKVPVWGNGRQGIYDFADGTAEQAARTATPPSCLLGRAFGAADGVIGIDCDHWIPPHAWTNGTGYRELSQSRTGAHFLCRVPETALPSNLARGESKEENAGKTSKILLTKEYRNKLGDLAADCGDVELFVGRANGIALTEYDAGAGAPDLDPDSAAGKLVYGLLSLAGEKSAGKPAPTTRAPEEPAPAGDLTPFVDATRNYRIDETDPSSAFLAYTTRIAGDLAAAQARTGRAWMTYENILDVWEQTDAFPRCYPHGKDGKKYARHKIEPTITKAYQYGLQKLAEYTRAEASVRPRPRPPAPPVPEAPAPRHAEGFCVSPDGVPEFWCRKYDHPLRHDLAYIAKFAQESMYRPRAVSAWDSALLAGATIVVRQYTGNDGFVSPRIYILISGTSGAGKGDIVRALRAIFAEIDPKMVNRLLVPNSSWTSDAAVHASIATHPQAVAVWDECGHKISQMLGDSIGLGVFSKLTEAFSAADSVLQAKRYAEPPAKGKGEEEKAKYISVLHPGMSVVGLGTPDQLAAITEDMVGDGRFARWIYVSLPDDPIPMRVRDPKHPPRLNLETANRLRNILKTATMRPDEENPVVLNKITNKWEELPYKQEIIRNLNLAADSPKSWVDLDLENQRLHKQATTEADRAAIARRMELAGALAVTRQLFGTDAGLASTEIEWDVMRECIDEMDVSISDMHDLWAAAPAYTQRELRIAALAAEIFHAAGTSRVWWSDLAAALKTRGIIIGGKNNERRNIDAILDAEYKIHAARENNSPTGRKYYYDASDLRAQAAQEQYDESLRRSPVGK